MPLIAFLCECKNYSKKYYRQVKDVPASIVCEKCSKEMKKCLSAPTSDSKIVIDNGFMARSIEVNENIIEINEERSRKDYRNED